MTEKEHEIIPLTIKELKEFSGLFTGNINKKITGAGQYILLGTRKDGRSIGAIAGTRSENGMYSIESLYVEPDERGMGAGTALFEEFRSIVRDVDPKALIHAGFRDDEYGDAESLLNFFNAMGLPESDAMAEGEHHFVFRC